MKKKSSALVVTGCIFVFVGFILISSVMANGFLLSTISTSTLGTHSASDRPIDSRTLDGAVITQSTKLEWGRSYTASITYSNKLAGERDFHYRYIVRIIHKDAVGDEIRWISLVHWETKNIELPRKLSQGESDTFTFLVEVPPYQAHTQVYPDVAKYEIWIYIQVYDYDADGTERTEYWHHYLDIIQASPAPTPIITPTPTSSPTSYPTQTPYPTNYPTSTPTPTEPPSTPPIEDIFTVAFGALFAVLGFVLIWVGKKLS